MLSFPCLYFLLTVVSHISAFLELYVESCIQSYLWVMTSYIGNAGFKKYSISFSRVLDCLLSYLGIEREKYIYEAYSSLYLICSPFLFT
jgi:hypothetical protein